jgi:transcription-repair coupling factor (superfamily II helicase)
VERPVLAPDELFLPPAELAARLDGFARVDLESFKAHDLDGTGHNFPTGAPQEFRIDLRAEKPLQPLANFVTAYDGRVLLAVDSAGRREVLLEMLRPLSLAPPTVTGWHEFVDGQMPFAVSAPGRNAGADAPSRILRRSCAISPRSARVRRWYTKSMASAATSACR